MDCVPLYVLASQHPARCHAPPLDDRGSSESPSPKQYIHV
jgi:hypothetical protein